MTYLEINKFMIINSSSEVVKIFDDKYSADCESDRMNSFNNNDYRVVIGNIIYEWDEIEDENYL